MPERRRPGRIFQAHEAEYTPFVFSAFVAFDSGDQHIRSVQPVFDDLWVIVLGVFEYSGVLR